MSFKTNKLFSKTTIAVLTIVLSLVIAGCSSGDKGESVTIDWMILESGQEIPEFYEKEVIEPFEEKHENVTINLIPNDDAINLMRQQLAAGAGPDIISADGPVTIKQFANAGYLLPLDEFSEEYGWEDHFDEWAYQTGLYDGSLYGLPREQEALVVWYNKDMFEENGWEVPTNLDEFEALNDDIQSNDVIPFAFGTTNYKAANEWWLSMVYSSYLTQDEYQGVLTGEIPWTDESVEEATSLWDDMWKKGYISDKQSQAISGDEAQSLFDSQKAAMVMEGTWLLSTLENSERDFEYDFFVMPSWRDGEEAKLPLALGTSTGINAKTDHPDIVAEFLDWTHSLEVVEKFAELGRVIPLEGMNISNVDNISDKILEVFEEVDKYVDSDSIGYASWTFWSPKAQYYLWDNIEAVFLDQLSVEDYLKNVQEEMEKDLEDGIIIEF